MDIFNKKGSGSSSGGGGAVSTAIRTKFIDNDDLTGGFIYTVLTSDFTDYDRIIFEGSIGVRLRLIIPAGMPVLERLEFCNGTTPVEIDYTAYTKKYSGLPNLLYNPNIVDYLFSSIEITIDKSNQISAYVTYDSKLNEKAFAFDFNRTKTIINSTVGVKVLDATITKTRQGKLEISGMLFGTFNYTSHFYCKVDGVYINKATSGNATSSDVFGSIWHGLAGSDPLIDDYVRPFSFNFITESDYHAGNVQVEIFCNSAYGATSASMILNNRAVDDISGSSSLLVKEL